MSGIDIHKSMGEFLFESIRHSIMDKELEGYLREEMVLLLCPKDYVSLLEWAGTTFDWIYLAREEPQILGVKIKIQQGQELPILRVNDGHKIVDEWD